MLTRSRKWAQLNSSEKEHYLESLRILSNCEIENDSTLPEKQKSDGVDSTIEDSLVR